MSKTIKLILIIFGVIVLLLVSAMIIVSTTVDPNAFKPKIADLVKKHTGRDLVVSGDFGLKIFPSIELTIGKASLGNVKGFGKNPFLEINSTELAIELLPLLSKELKIKKVTLGGLRLNLVVKKDGKTNWKKLLNKNTPAVYKSTPSSTQVTKFPKEKGSKSAKPTPLITGFELSELAITDAEVELRDRRSGKRMVLDQIEFGIGKVVPGNSTQLKLNLYLKGVKTIKDGRLLVSSNLILKKNLDGLVFSDLNVQLAGQKIKGSFELDNFANPQVLFNLESDRLNFDQLDDVLTKFRKASIMEKKEKLRKKSLERNAESKTNEKVGATPTVASSSVTTQKRMQFDERKNYNVKGTFNANTLVVANLNLQEFSLNLSGSKGLIELAPIKAKAYGGEYDGKVVLDARKSKPVITFTESLKGLQSEPFLTDLLKEPSMFTGILNLSGTASASVDRRLESLTGSFKFEFIDGALKDINITHMLRLARAKLKGEPTPTDEKRQTDFSSLTGTASIKNGVIYNRDLTVKAPTLGIGGDGSVDMVTEKISYLLTTTLVESLEGQGRRELKKLVGIPIPIRVSGSFDTPIYKVDLEHLITGSAKSKALEKLQRKLEKKGLGDLLKF